MLISYGINLSNEEANIIMSNFQKDSFKETFTFEEFYSLVKTYKRDN